MISFIDPNEIPVEAVNFTPPRRLMKEVTGLVKDGLSEVPKGNESGVYLFLLFFYPALFQQYYRSYTVVTYFSLLSV